MCQPYISYKHKCKDSEGAQWVAVFSDLRQVCPLCGVRLGQLLAAGRAAPQRSPSTGQGGLTGRAVVRQSLG